MTSTASRSETDDDRWYFGEIDSKTASNHLNSAGGQEGTFLVRKSCSSPGNYVLSFISEGEPVDILICNYWQDAFYSLITDSEKIFHGLDTLIDHYTQNSVAGDSGTLLIQPCIGDSPPSETRLHGSSNLLHRAVSQANTTIVSELLKSGYRKIDAKNSLGQTALHVACVSGNVELVRLLLGADANPNVRDQEGMTPLQIACRHDFPAVLDLLIKEGGAKIQLRTPVSGEVALHEAAACGNLECVKILLSHHAPAWPRAAHNRTPAMLAKVNYHLDCYSLLVNHRPTIPLVRLPEYYQSRISREAAERLLRNNGDYGGQFLLRKSSKNEPGFVLSLMHSGQIFHFQIQKGGSMMYFIDDGPYFKCLETLMDHYSRFCDGLPCRLTTPIPPDEPLEEEEFKKIYQGSGPNRNEMEPLLVNCEDDTDDFLLNNVGIDSRYMSLEAGKFIPQFQNFSLKDSNANSMMEGHHCLSAHPSIPETIFSPSSFPGGFDAACSYPTIKGNKTDEVFGAIDSNSLKVGDTLGVGEFGTVLKGVWISPSGDHIDVAVKTLHQNDSLSKDNFFREAKVMIDLNHPYIVKLLGVCQGPPIAMVQELANMGSLLNFLLDSPEQIQPDFHFKLWASQVADGMNYLEMKHFVHRDLASRNLLLSSITSVKISDFGLSRALNANNDYYKATEGGRWPLKWYAPESIYYGQFTHLSDVWSYGVTVWEMYTFGDQPYGELTGHQVANLLDKGERLPQPKDCPDATYQLMIRCWHASPKQRPTFRQLVVIFRGSKDYVNIKPYIKNN